MKYPVKDQAEINKALHGIHEDMQKRKDSGMYVEVTFKRDLNEVDEKETVSRFGVH